MHTLTANEMTVLSALANVENMAADEGREMPSPEQIETLAINLEKKESSIKSTLQSLIKKGCVRKNHPVLSNPEFSYELTSTGFELSGNDGRHKMLDQLCVPSDPIACDAELIVLEAERIVAEADKPARVTAHTDCDHPATKAARAKCRRQRNAS